MKTWTQSFYLRFSALMCGFFEMAIANFWALSSPRFLSLMVCFFFSWTTSHTDTTEKNKKERERR